MATATDTYAKVEEKVTDLVSSIQEPVVANVRKVADVAEQRINDFELPAIESLPSTDELVAKADELGIAPLAPHPRRVLRRVRLFAISLHQLRPPDAAPDGIDHDLPGDEIEERGELGGRPVAVPCAVQLEESLLREIFDIPVNAAAQEKVHHGVLMLPHKL